MPSVIYIHRRPEGYAPLGKTSENMMIMHRFRPKTLQFDSIGVKMLYGRITWS
jgi:hypothetical protein